MFSLKEMNSIMSSIKCGPFCLGLSVLTVDRVFFSLYWVYGAEHLVEWSVKWHPKAANQRNFQLCFCSHISLMLFTGNYWLLKTMAVLQFHTLWLSDPVCPKGSVYKPCANVCESTCENLVETRESCERPCLPGCECRPGRVRYQNKCILRELCPNRDGVTKDPFVNFSVIKNWVCISLMP